MVLLITIYHLEGEYLSFQKMAYKSFNGNLTCASIVIYSQHYLLIIVFISGFSAAKGTTINTLICEDQLPNEEFHHWFAYIILYNIKMNIAKLLILRLHVIHNRHISQSLNSFFYLQSLFLLLYCFLCALHWWIYNLYKYSITYFLAIIKQILPVHKYWLKRTFSFLPWIYYSPYE